MAKRKEWMDLFSISALGLFLEMIFIRWISSELRMIAYYKNFALIGAFLGLGLGFAVSNKKNSSSTIPALPILLFASVILITGLGRTQISDLILANQVNAQEYFWAGIINNNFLAFLFKILFYIFLFLIFTLITLVFIPVGVMTAQKFAPFSPLKAYTINVLGSLFGILFYTLISFLNWEPYSWFLICGVGLVYFVGSTIQKNRRVLFAVVCFLPVFVTLIPDSTIEKTFWSPYYRIDLRSVHTDQEPKLFLGYELMVNKAWHQRLWDLGKDFVAQNYDLAPGHFDTYLAGYDLPLTAAASLKNVLIVGAGTGNDVASVLRAGAGHITAVEIDPTMIKIGKMYHPEQPYKDLTNITVVIQDARTFFHQDTSKYDLIIFGRLDSHTLFSGASSVRLDSFVYTIESITDVKKLLADDGVLVLSHGVTSQYDWIVKRLFRILNDVFGHNPQVYEMPEGVTTFIIGKNEFGAQLINDPRVIYRPDYTYDSSVDVIRDQWPFLYIRDRSIPTTYVIGLLGVFLISLVFAKRLLPGFRSFSPHFFFMGAAFFLLETKSITEIALLMGSTWVVNAAVIATILLMIVISNMVVQRYKIENLKLYYLLLGVSLAINYFVPTNRFLGLPPVGQVLASSSMLAIPFLFAGIIFAVTFKKEERVEVALGSNLIGSVLGGIFEYSSILFGLKALYLFAIVFYFFSAVSWFNRKA